MRASVLAAAVAAAAPRAQAAPATAPSPELLAPTSQPVPPAEALHQYITRLGTALAQGTQTQRTEAAERLLEIGTPEARLVVTRGIFGNDEKVHLACARALADRPAGDPQWIGPLARMLGRDRYLTEAAARALAQYGQTPEAYQALIRFAKSRQQPGRAAAVRFMGEVVQKPVAGALVELIGDPNEDPSVRSAAADALVQLSGQSAFGQDVRRWAAWWDARKARPPQLWRADVLEEQHASLEHDADRTRDQIKQFKRSVRDLLLNQYNRQPPADRAKTLLGFLNDANADVREVGASLVPDAVASGQPMTPEIHRRLIELVGDASADVRLQATYALIGLTDVNALSAVLVQLQVESEPDVQVALLQAVARIGGRDARAVAVVRLKLHEASPKVAAAAADALRALAPVIHTDPNQAREVIQELQDLLRQRTGPPGQPANEPGDEDLRAAIVGALAALADKTSPLAMEDLFASLLNQGESPRVRRAALEGLAGLGERTGDVVAHELDPNVEPDPTVRQQAATALGQIGSFNYATQLDNSTRPRSEPDKAVREAAWKAFQGLLPSPSASTRELVQWADLFGRRKEADREVAVLKALTRKLTEAGDTQNLAIEQQRTGEVYLQLNQPADAVPYLRHALAYWETKQAQPQTIVYLVRELMIALLQSGQYQDAVRFGEQEIRRDPTNQQEIGPAIRNAAEQLLRKGDPQSTRDAGLLIHQALAMNPPLDEIYRDQLQSLGGQK